MAEQLVRSAGVCKYLLFTLTLLLSVLRLMQCRNVADLSAPEVAGVRLPHKRHVGFRVDLVHRDSALSPLSPGDITSTERLQRAIERGQARQLNFLTSLDGEKFDATAPVSPGEGEYLLAAKIGTPSHPFLGVLDTGSDLIWTQCSPCTDCFNQTDPIYDPSKSSTHGSLPCTNSLCTDLPISRCSANRCHYTYQYGDNSTTKGILAYETLALSSEKLRRIGFGCSNDNKGTFGGADGIIGFGRGPLSLISQLGPSGANKFSYCLVSLGDSSSQTSPLLIGDSARLKSNRPGTTPLIQSDIIPTFYYLNLTGISIGGTLLDIPSSAFDLRDDGSGGVIIDSGTTVTVLQTKAFRPVRTALTSAINLPKKKSRVGLDICFEEPSQTSNITAPAVTFHFDGADWNVPTDNYLISDGEGAICAAFQGSSDQSIIGNLQQENFEILYDNERNLLSFAPADCETV